MKKRIWCAAIAAGVFLIALAGRILYLQTATKETLAQQAVEERSLEIEVGSGRGMIFDRNLILLTSHAQTKAVIFPQAVENPDAVAEFLSAYSHKRIMKAECMQLPYTELQLPVAKADIDREIPKGVILLECNSRYGDAHTACHLMGYQNGEGKGVTGLEKAYEYVLGEGSSIRARIMVSAGHTIPFSDEVTYIEEENPKERSLVLTIDQPLQTYIEDIMEKNKYRGSVIVTDLENGDVLSYVSAPYFQPGNVETYIDGERREMVDRAQSPFEPGSVFKLVMSAAALEAGEDAFTYTCDGVIDVGGVQIPCHEKEGHGPEDLTLSLKNSCNPAFIALGERLGKDRIIDTAYLMGLGGTKTAYQNQPVSEGNLPVYKNLPAEIANLSIGQGDVQVTPFQVAGMLDVIANEGKKRPLNVVAGIGDKDGKIILDQRRKGGEQVIKPSTAMTIIKMMEETVNGTASNGKIEGMRTACKTGTAQTGWDDGKGGVMTHAWFVGICMADQPKYGVTVFIEDGKQGNTVAGKVFAQIAEKLKENLAE